MLMLGGQPRPEDLEWNPRRLLPVLEEGIAEQLLVAMLCVALPWYIGLPPFMRRRMR
jgi:hypothetical protein